MVLLDTVSLMKSGISDDDYRWLKESAAVAQCWRVAMLLVGTLEEVFLGGPAQGPYAVHAGARERWRTRYTAALERMRQAGINTVADPAAGFGTYMSLRERWDGHIARLRASMLFEPGEIDAPTDRPEVVGAGRTFEHRLRDV